MATKHFCRYIKKRNGEHEAELSESSVTQHSPLTHSVPSEVLFHIQATYNKKTVGEIHQRALAYNQDAAKKNASLWKRKQRKYSARTGKEARGNWYGSPERAEYDKESIFRPSTNNLARYLDSHKTVADTVTSGEWSKAVRDLLACVRVLEGDSKLDKLFEGEVFYKKL